MVEAENTINSNQFNQETVSLCSLFVRDLKGELKKAALLPAGLTEVSTSPWKAQVKKDENCYIQTMDGFGGGITRKKELHTAMQEDKPKEVPIGL